MTNLRTAAQQALEFADDIVRGKYKGNAEEIRDALRAALSAQPEPAAPTVVRTMSTTDEIMALAEVYAGAERLTHREQAWNALRTAVERLVAAPTVVEPAGPEDMTVCAAIFAKSYKPPVTEPVAYWYYGNAYSAAELSHQAMRDSKPLYLEGPPRTALTDTEIDALLPDSVAHMNTWEACRLFARAIERAHGIGKAVTP